MTASTAKTNIYICSWLGKLGQFLVTFGLFVCLLVVGALALFSIPFSWWNTEVVETLTFKTVLSSPVNWLASLLVFVFICWMLHSFIKSEKPVNTKRVFVASIAFFVFAQLIWVLLQQTDNTWYSDAHQLLQYSDELSKGELSQTSYGYLVCYPYQSGFYLFETALRCIFGDKTPLTLQLINIVANAITYVCFYYIGLCLIESDKARCILSVLLATFLPCILYSSFMYGNQIGFSCVMLYSFFNVHALRNQNESLSKLLAWFTLSFIALALMFWLKSTYLIVALAFLIVWFINLLRQPKLRNLLLFSLSVLVLVFANMLSAIPQNYIETRYNVDLGDGMPKTLWVCIGLQNNSVLGSEMPGWWGPFALNTLEETSHSYTAMQEVGWSAIQQSLKQFADNPSYGLWFFTYKLGSEWLTPDFQSRYFAEINYRTFVNDSGEAYTINFSRHPISGNNQSSSWEKMSGLVCYLVDYGLRPFMEAYQSLIYSAAFLGLLALWRKRQELSALHILLPCCFIVGFTVYALWEAKSQYVMPFFMMLIPVAAYGVQELFSNPPRAAII